MQGVYTSCNKTFICLGHSCNLYICKNAENDMHIFYSLERLRAKEQLALYCVQSVLSH